MAHSMRIKRPDNPYSLLIKILIIVTGGNSIHKRQ